MFAPPRTRLLRFVLRPEWKMKAVRPTCSAGICAQRKGVKESFLMLRIGFYDPARAM